MFTRSTNADRDVFSVHTSGAGLIRLTNTPDRFEFAPVWSPAGTRIAFVGCSPTTSDCGIYVMGRDGTSEAQVVLAVSGGEGAVDWQPLSAGGPPRDLVVGSGSATFDDFPSPGESTREQFVVSAHSGPLGEDPQGKLTFHSPLLADGTATADVACLRVDGDRARVGGMFEEPVVYVDARIGWFLLIVEDSGPPGHRSDLMNAAIFLDRPRPPGFSPCDFDLPAEFPIDEGNFEVKDASTVP